MTHFHRLLVATFIGLTLVALAACGAESPTPTTAVPGQTPTAGGAPAATPTADPGFDAEAYFRGKTIRLMTSSAPGGGTDIQMRYLASFLRQYIPGSPRIIASNVPPHVVGINYLNRSRPDGLTIGIFATSPIQHEFSAGAAFDSREFSYIADVGVKINVITARGNLPYDSIHDMIGASGPVLRTMYDISEPGSMEAEVMALLLMAEFLELPFEIIRSAERGTGPSLLALERGDINWQRLTSAWFTVPNLRPGWFTDGFINPILNWTPGRGFLPNAEVSEENFPHIYDLLTEEQRDMYVGLTEWYAAVGRPIMMAPGVAPEVLAALESAFHAAFHDPTFCDGWERVTGGMCGWTPGAQAKELTVEGHAARAVWADQYDPIAQRLFTKYVR